MRANVFGIHVHENGINVNLVRPYAEHARILHHVTDTLYFQHIRQPDSVLLTWHCWHQGWKGVSQTQRYQPEEDS